MVNWGYSVVYLSVEIRGGEWRSSGRERFSWIWHYSFLVFKNRFFFLVCLFVFLCLYVCLWVRCKSWVELFKKKKKWKWWLGVGTDYYLWKEEEEDDWLDWSEGSKWLIELEPAQKIESSRKQILFSSTPWYWYSCWLVQYWYSTIATKMVMVVIMIPHDFIHSAMDEMIFGALQLAFWDHWMMMDQTFPFPFLSVGFIWSEVKLGKRKKNSEK